jgi:hypothetical protein
MLKYTNPSALTECPADDTGAVGGHSRASQLIGLVVQDSGRRGIGDH